ncbi:alpha/beta fold hydrolase [Streptomyces purpureus]|uniref:Alpha/beta hydrolase n=1 Tax=Streptomyces purpureus TaxID=1951 RepID=A0A918HF18_9ACTN|nr:alpha/beta fold hydrolase [Streptomyces purpureus]GGT57166.1 alpha/beta hydrolase [Streptomyces purpureus]
MTLTHDIAGDGPTVLLLHSSVCDRRMWDPQWQPLVDAGYRVVRCDFRGHGETPADAGDYSDAEDVREMLDALGVDRAAVVASSFGGYVALEFAAAHPGRVTALALLCAGMPGHEAGPELRDFDAREDAFFDADDISGAVELNLDTWLGPDADADARAKVRVMQRHAFDIQLAADAEAEEQGAEEAQEAQEDPAVDLGRITAPTLAVSGAHDVSDFREMARTLAATLPAARHVELPWAGHLPSMERPKETTALLLDFLAAPAAP